MRVRICQLRWESATWLHSRHQEMISRSSQPSEMQGCQEVGTCHSFHQHTGSKVVICFIESLELHVLNKTVWARESLVVVTANPGTNICTATWAPVRYHTQILAGILSKNSSATSIIFTTFTALFVRQSVLSMATRSEELRLHLARINDVISTIRQHTVGYDLAIKNRIKLLDSLLEFRKASTSRDDLRDARKTTQQIQKEVRELKGFKAASRQRLRRLEEMKQTTRAYIMEQDYEDAFKAGPWC